MKKRKMARYGPFTPEGRLYQSARIAALRPKVGRRQEQEGRKRPALEKKGVPSFKIFTAWS